MHEFVAEGGERLDVALGAHVGSRSAAARLIDAGLVTVDGAVQPKRRVLKGGETVRWGPEPEIEEAPRAPATFTVAYEDEHLLIVDKPAGVVVHPAKGHRQGTLAQALEGRAVGGDDPWRAGIVHRLDRDTSGLLLVAASDEAYTALKAMLKRREVTREYLALVDGRPSARRGTIEAPIGRDRRVRTLISTDTDAPRDAVTHFEVEDAFSTTTLLRVRLQTGRTHQIRAHLKAIGHPVCGDPEYGKAGVFGLGRQFLHAERLALTHPVTGAPLEARSPLPQDLRAALDAARE
jgi:23S rRNA pseudouridine1911/1915/1917 synthase